MEGIKLPLRPHFLKPSPQSLRQRRFHLRRNQPCRIQILNVNLILQPETSQLHPKKIGDGRNPISPSVLS
jgi:hypothetical protein